jgi:hypothetical protein
MHLTPSNAGQLKNLKITHQYVVRSFCLRVLANGSTPEALQERDLGDTHGYKDTLHGVCSNVICLSRC